MRGVVAALRLETLYVKSWEELTIRLSEMLVSGVDIINLITQAINNLLIVKGKQFRIFLIKPDNLHENAYQI